MISNAFKGGGVTGRNVQFENHYMHYSEVWSGRMSADGNTVTGSTSAGAAGICQFTLTRL